MCYALNEVPGRTRIGQVISPRRTCSASVAERGSGGGGITPNTWLLNLVQNLPPTFNMYHKRPMDAQNALAPSLVASLL
jgi:hypothetical protein